MRMFSSVSDIFRLLFQVFHLDVAKVDLDVAYVAMTKYACYKPMFLVFQLFQTYITNISSRCFKNRSWCCTCCKWLYTHVSSVLSVFRRMLQVFNLDVSKVDLGEARVATATAPPGVTARLLCAFVCVKRSKLGVVLCMRGPVRPLERDGCGARELGASGAGARAPSDANISNRTSRRGQVSPN